jgi:eukaryotic-like serine/threonine-protein kinase
MSDVPTRLAAAVSDRYRLDRELGSGAMATVYLAHDLKHDRDVAIKVLHPDLGAALGGERFLSFMGSESLKVHGDRVPFMRSWGPFMGSESLNFHWGRVSSRYL